ncbi:hypothetical protein N7454_007060 [Penicillium verhagenii]|nr:hypothetical protein N7454_007060 [Penicillium verhagenii]
MKGPRILYTRVFSTKLASTTNLHHPPRTIQYSSYSSATPNSNREIPEFLERQLLRPDRAETCQSGTDDEVARHKSPYDPTQTSVDKEVSALRAEYKLERDLHDPLLVSPANQEVSMVLDPIQEMAHGTHVHVLGSAKGLTNKSKEVLLRKEPYIFRTYENVFARGDARQKARVWDT